MIQQNCLSQLESTQWKAGIFYSGTKNPHRTLEIVLEIDLFTEDQSYNLNIVLYDSLYSSQEVITRVYCYILLNYSIYDNQLKKIGIFVNLSLLTFEENTPLSTD